MLKINQNKKLNFYVYPHNYLKEDKSKGIIISSNIKTGTINIGELIKSDPLHNCDYYIVPFKLYTNDKNVLEKFVLPQLIYYQQNYKKHIFFNLSDKSPYSYNSINNSIIFEISCLKNKNKITYPFYYNPIVNPVDFIDINTCKYDLCFLGLAKPYIREKMLSIVENFKIKKFLKNIFFWKEKNKKKLKILYHQIMQQSKFVLCPRGNGPQTVRFYEALAFGRIPILISDNVRLPLENIINYDEFIIRVKENEIKKIEEKINFFIKKNDLNFISKKCRNIWVNYFSNKNLKNFIEKSLLN